MRKIFIDELIVAAKKNKKIILIVNDLGYNVVEKFAKLFPSQFFNAGVAEQNMMGIASGMALEGLKPWVYTITPFLIERPFEQIKLDIDQQKSNVKLIGYADYPNLGPTHKELNAKKQMKLFKNITSFFPKNKKDTINYCKQSYKNDGPCFISLKQIKR